MKKSIGLILLCTLIFSTQCTQKEINWKISDNPILTEWALKVDPLKPWPEYPRPDMERKNWINLNGLWDYAVTNKDVKPENWDGEILVPFPLESALSGVKRRISDDQNLWYRTEFSVPKNWKKGQILLNFEASDWETKVWIDGNEAGVHRGGYDPFSFEISGLLKEGKTHELMVCVWDPTSSGPQPRGKQVNNPEGIWYTPTTGIWQTVWLEPVNKSHISSFRMVSDIEAGTMSFLIFSANSKDNVNVTISDNGKIISQKTGNPGSEIKLKIENPKLWTPDNPFLYDVTIDLRDGHELTDRITSVAGMRKISIGKTKDGIIRLLLNNEFIFQNGPLDQGFWPDGLYTPPTDEAMIYDLKLIKEMGMNMLRKHVKVENRRFYNWCDKMGILVWQDMPSGDKYISGSMPDIDKSPEAKVQFEFELKRMIETKFNHPSIIMWVPFNEGWGQYETEGITRLIKEYDPTRLVNSVSGWTDRGTGDVKDIHTYPNPRSPEPEETRAIVLGEYGGLGFPVKDHLWEAANWGYKTFEDSIKLLATYESYLDQIYRFVKNNGLSAVVYTQTSDVETETNGLLTYDRKVIKMNAENVARANTGITPPMLERTIHVFTDEFPVTLTSHDSEAKILYTMDGTEPDGNSKQYKSPFAIKEACVIKAVAKYGEKSSRIVSFNLEKKEIIPAKFTGKYKKGLNVKIFQGNFTSVPDFAGLTPVKNENSTSINPGLSEINQNFALAFDGFIQIPEDGIYGFFINSNAGSKLVLNDEIILSNEGVRTRSVEKGEYFALGKGFHKLHIGYFQTTGNRPVLRLIVEIPGKPRSEIPPEWLYH